MAVPSLLDASMDALESRNQGELAGGSAALIWSPELALASPTAAMHATEFRNQARDYPSM
jgi:hypothetical protein